MRRHDNLVQLVLDTLAAHYFYTVGHALQRLKRLWLYLKVQLRCKTDASHHAQWVVAKGDARLQGRGYDAILQISQSVKRINQFTKTCFVQTDGHRVDGEVATILIVLQRTILYDRFARVVTVALLASPHKLHLVFHALLTEFHLGRTKVLKHTKMRFLTHHALQFLSHLDATANHNDINIVRWAFQEYVSYISSHHITLQPQTVCGFTYLVEYFLI